MRKKLLSALLSVGLIVSLAPAAFAASTANAIPTNDTLRVNGQVRNATVYKIGSSNYFKIRDVAAVLNGTDSQFGLGYDAASKSVTVTTGRAYEPTGKELAGAASGSRTAAVSNDKIMINGAAAKNVTVYKIGGSNYFKIRDLGRVLGFEVEWSAGQGMMISTRQYADGECAEHEWVMVHVNAVGYYKNNETHGVQIFRCGCGYEWRSDKDEKGAWNTHYMNCPESYRSWWEDIPNVGREWVEIVPAYDEVYCKNCGAHK